MGTTAEKLQAVLTAKNAIRDAIIGKGGEITASTPLSQYADAITAIPSGGGSPFTGYHLESTGAVRGGSASVGTPSYYVIYADGTTETVTTLGSFSCDGVHAVTISGHTSYSEHGAASIFAGHRFGIDGSYNYAGSVILSADVSSALYVPSGCFASGTRILTADGSYIPVDDVDYRTELSVWDFDLGRLATAFPVWVKRRESTRMYRICRFSDGTDLRLVGEYPACHRVFSEDKGRFEYANLCVGDTVPRLVDGRLDHVVLESIRDVVEDVDYFNVITARHMNLFAEGVLTSSRMNNLYPVKDLRYIKAPRVVRDAGEFMFQDERAMKFYTGLRLYETNMSTSDVNEFIRIKWATDSENI